SRREAEALLLETPFVSAVAVAADRYGFLPVGLLMHDQFPVDQWIVEVEEPVFVAHGTADTTIGYTHGERVHALAPNPAGLWIEPDAGHGDLWERGIWERAREFFEDAAGQQEGACQPLIRRCAPPSPPVGAGARRTDEGVSNENAGPLGPAPITTERRRTSVQRQAGECDREVEGGLRLDAPGLQGEAAPGAADQPVGTEADADGRFRRSADIGT